MPGQIAIWCPTCHPCPLRLTGWPGTGSGDARLWQSDRRLSAVPRQPVRNGTRSAGRNWPKARRRGPSIIACCDSRADPATIFDTDPGEIFVVRNVANLVPPFEASGGRHGVSAALEFAVTQLNVPEIVVMGHERCGGITAALTGKFHGCRRRRRRVRPPMDEPDRSAGRAKSPREHGTGEDAQRLLEEVAIRQSLANLRSFPVRRRTRKKWHPQASWGAIFPFAMANFGCSTRRKIASAPSEQLALTN